MRMIRPGQWDVDVLVSEMRRDVLNWLPETQTCFGPRHS
jgi:hypothetical protein